MTQPTMHDEMKSAPAVGTQENSESNQDAQERDNRVANPPIEEPGNSFKEYCAANPSASECKVYDL